MTCLPSFMYNHIFVYCYILNIKNQVKSYIFLYIAQICEVFFVKRRLLPLFLILSFFLMLLKPQETFKGACEGLLLWFQILLPTLLPFLIIINLLVHTNTMIYFAKFLSPVLSPLFRTSPNGTFAVVAGFLCGYPMGAKIIADLIFTNKIDKNEGAYLLSFCNNTSPMFIMNYVVLKHLHQTELLLPTLCILIASPIFCSFLFRHYYPSYSSIQVDTPHIQFHFSLLDNSIMNAFESITKVGGYVILFSVLLSWGKELPFRFFLPFLEITNGIPMILSSDIPFSSAYILVMALVSFGGICSIAQTQCMLDGTGLKIIPYIAEKLITTIVTSFLTYLFLKFIKL